jgi:hypothetical protein
MFHQGGAVAASGLLTIGDVARLAEVPREAVDKAMRFGVLRYTRQDGRRMVRPDDAEAWSGAVRIVRVPSRWERRVSHAQ